MDSRQNEETAPTESHVSRGAVQLMVLILVAMALVAILSNVQKAQRSQIETVTITPAVASPSPAAP